MRIKPETAIKQKAAMAPRLYQSLRILRMSAADLSDYIQQEIAENPVLEMPEPGELGEIQPVPLESGTGGETNRELWSDLESAEPGPHGAGRVAAPAFSSTEMAVSPETLADHLALQLDLLDLDRPGQAIGKAILGSLDEHGYLRDSVDEIARITGSEPEAVEAVLVKIQKFDPPGIAARSLEECLCLQIRQLGESEIACRIAESYLDHVARGAFAYISRQMGIPVPEVQKAVELIRSLNPAPGDSFDVSPPAASVIPDIYARLEGGRVRILPSRETMPHLRLSKLYGQIASGERAADRQTVEYAQGKIASASQLIGDLDRRRSTLARVAGEIAASQPEFFAKGPTRLRPLSLEEVAARLNLHPSTVSRAILGKYISTPYGVFELRYFFSGGYHASSGELSATAVKKKLELLIAGEDTARPLSDQKLAGLLEEQGLTLSRRTVAKYREAMGIPASRERKRRAGGGAKRRSGAA